MPISNEAKQRLMKCDQEMLLLLAQHKTNKEIAACFGISPETIKSRLALLYRRYGVHGRQDLVQAALVAPDAASAT